MVVFYREIVIFSLLIRSNAPFRFVLIQIMGIWEISYGSHSDFVSFKIRTTVEIIEMCNIDWQRRLIAILYVYIAKYNSSL